MLFLIKLIYQSKRNQTVTVDLRANFTTQHSWEAEFGAIAYNVSHAKFCSDYYLLFKTSILDWECLSSDL